MVITRSLKITIFSLIILTALLVTVLASVPNKPYSGKYEDFVSGDSNSLRSTMIVEKPVFTIGEPLNVILRLSNMGTEKITLSYTDSHTMELYLYSQYYGLVTFLGKGCGYLLVLTDIILTPGETEQWNISWTRIWREESIKPGKYFLQGEILRAAKTPFLPITIIPKVSI